MIKIRIHIFTGFLGTGKTTAIIELLERKPPEEQWAIVVNEFGKISIDGKTLSSGAEGQSVFEISGGCICCSAKAYFLEDMEKIISTGRFDRIIVEPSGLGGTDHITELVAQHPELQLMPVVCLVDITMIVNPRLKLLPIYRSQILKADFVLFSKSELLTEPELTVLIENFQTDFPGKNCLLKSQFDFQLSFKKDEDTRIRLNDEKEDSVKTPGQIPEGKSLQTDLRTWSIVDRHSCMELCLTFPSRKTINMQALKEILEKEKSILRAKGYIYSGKEWALFNYTLSGLMFERCQPHESNELAIIFESTDKTFINSFGKKIEAFFQAD